MNTSEQKFLRIVRDEAIWSDLLALIQEPGLRSAFEAEGSCDISCNFMISYAIIRVIAIL